MSTAASLRSPNGEDVDPFSVKRAPSSVPSKLRVDADLGIVRQARQERDADREIRQRDLAPMQAVVERDGAAVDLDVVERELRRRRVRRLEERVDQVLDVVRAVRVARIRDSGAGEPQRVEHRRKPP